MSVKGSAGMSQKSRKYAGNLALTLEQSVEFTVKRELLFFMEFGVKLTVVM